MIGGMFRMGGGCFCRSLVVGIGVWGSCLGV